MFSAFTIERYCAVCRPLRGSSLSTTRRAVKIQIFIWLIAILSSTPYFYITKSHYHQCTFDENYQLLATISFHISATFFFVLPATILCLLYACMAQRLYNIGLLHEKVNWSKSKRRNSLSCPMGLQHLGLTDRRIEEHFRAKRHLSSPTVLLARQSGSRYGNTSSPGLTLHIQSMKKSAFKMLCKFFFLCSFSFSSLTSISKCVIPLD